MKEVQARFGQLPTIHSIGSVPENEWRKPELWLAVGEALLPHNLSTCVNVAEIVVYFSWNGV